jgi:hypothetical protein
MDPLDEIQPGWQVLASDGEEVGKVVDVSERVLHVKQTGLLGGQVHIPETAIESAEDRIVQLSVSKRELESGAG